MAGAHPADEDILATVMVSSLASQALTPKTPDPRLRMFVLFAPVGLCKAQREGQVVLFAPAGLCKAQREGQARILHQGRVWRGRGSP
jgi:hypothetical protein